MIGAVMPVQYELLKVPHLWLGDIHLHSWRRSVVHCGASVASCHRLGTAAPDAGKAISERPWGVPRGMQAQSCMAAAVSAVVRVGA